jgi:hypothetical protein
MSLFDLLAIAAPALLVVAAAIHLAARARRDGEAVLDLREVPVVVLATRQRPIAEAVPSAPAQGALVEPGVGGSLGARLRSAATAPPPDEDRAEPSVTRVVRVRRRRPLVAVSREPSAR